MDRNGTKWIEGDRKPDEAENGLRGAEEEKKMVSGERGKRKGLKRSFQIWGQQLNSLSEGTTTVDKITKEREETKILTKGERVSREN